MFQQRYPYFVITICILLVYCNSLGCDFTFDDNSAIVQNRHVRSNESTWWSVFSVDYWGTPIESEHSHKSYRPVTLLTFRLNYLISGLDPFGYHLGNVLLHLLVSLVCYKFMLNILNHDVWSSLLFTLFFALHPLKSEAVAGIVGRAELLCTLFTLFSLFCYFDSSFLSFSIYVILATLSKEQGITVPCICIILEVCRLYLFYQNIRPYSFTQITIKLAQHFSFIRILFLVIFTGIISATRVYLMGGSLPVFTKFDNPASFEETPIRQLTYNYLLPLNVKLVLYPVALCADWTMNSIPLVRDFEDFRNVWTVLFYLVLLLLIGSSINQLMSTRSVYRSYYDKTNLCIALALTVIPFIPASNLLFPVGFVIAERILYTPSLGFSLILAIGFRKIKNNFNSKLVHFVIYSAALITVALLGLRTYQRNFDWKNDLTLFQSGLKVNPNNAKLYNNIGHFYERQQRYEEAIEFFRQAASKDSDDIGSELNIARALIHLNKIEEAESLLWSIKPKVRQSAIKRRIIPHYLNIWINLARVISMNNSRLHEAENLYREVISIRRDFIDAYINLGEIFIRREQYEDAISIYKQALIGAEFKDDLKLADVHYNIAISKTLQVKHGQRWGTTRSNAEIENAYNQIAQSFAHAIEINPEHKEALINLAILVQKPEFARQNCTYYRNFVLQALKVYTKDDEQEIIQFNIALTLLDLGGPNNRVEALEHLKRAIQIKPNFRGALYNLALLYFGFEDYNTSALYLEQLNAFHPNYAKALLLSGDVYSKLGQLDLAEKFYTQMLQVESNNFEAQQKLCFVLQRTNHLQKARECLSSLLDHSIHSRK